MSEPRATEDGEDGSVAHLQARWHASGDPGEHRVRR